MHNKLAYCKVSNGADAAKSKQAWPSANSKLARLASLKLAKLVNARGRQMSCGGDSLFVRYFAV